MLCQPGRGIQAGHCPLWQLFEHYVHNLFFFFFYLFYLFIFGCVGSLLLCTGFLQLQRAGATTLRWGARASHCGGFSCCRARALECRLSSCGTRAQLLHGMQDLPGPGLEPVSPALAGGFITTAPPRRPSPSSLNQQFMSAIRPAHHFHTALVICTATV